MPMSVPMSMPGSMGDPTNMSMIKSMSGFMGDPLPEFLYETMPKCIAAIKPTCLLEIMPEFQESLHGEYLYNMRISSRISSCVWLRWWHSFCLCFRWHHISDDTTVLILITNREGNSVPASVPVSMFASNLGSVFLFLIQGCHSPCHYPMVHVISHNIARGYCSSCFWPRGCSSSCFWLRSCCSFFIWPLASQTLSLIQEGKQFLFLSSSLIPVPFLITDPGGHLSYHIWKVQKGEAMFPLGSSQFPLFQLSKEHQYTLWGKEDTHILKSWFCPLSTGQLQGYKHFS